MRYLGLFGLVCLLCFIGEQSSAGAWSRTKGSVFFSSSASMSWPKDRPLSLPDVYGSAYAEYGLGRSLTLGMDVGSSDSTKSSKLKAVGFIRYNLSNPNARHQLAVDLGGGSYLGNSVIRAGAAFGMGLKLMDRTGWLSLEGHTLFDLETRKSAKTLDGTLGITMKRSKIMGQFSAFQSARQQSTMSFTPSYALDLKSGRHLEISLSFNVKGKTDPALKIGIWQDF
ncbi:hypothetical protein [Planktotalea sp.]|uniref:hypothetical protein n=1 Tax=Planktotalea sp. TaxID=2029877 RepID=UPI0025D6266A|nr:hypothetical protein [Planktotalea sp.]